MKISHVKLDQAFAVHGTEEGIRGKVSQEQFFLNATELQLSIWFNVGEGTWAAAVGRLLGLDDGLDILLQLLHGINVVITQLLNRRFFVVKLATGSVAGSVKNFLKAGGGPFARALGRLHGSEQLIKLFLRLSLFGNGLRLGNLFFLNVAEKHL